MLYFFFSISYANKSYSTHSYFHIFMDSSVHIKPFNTRLIERLFSQYFLATTKNQNEASYNYFDKRMNTIYQSFFEKMYFKREKLNIFLKINFQDTKFVK